MLVQADTLVVIRSNTHIGTCIVASHVLRPFSLLFMTGFTDWCLADVLKNKKSFSDDCTKDNDKLAAYILFFLLRLLYTGDDIICIKS